MSVDTSLGQFFATALNGLELDAIKTTLPLIDSTTSNVIANPAPANLVAQKTVFMVSLAAALPNLEAAAVQGLASQVKADIDALAASLTAPNKPAA